MNLEAAILLTRACLKGMLPQRSGSIVNIASVNALRGHAGVSVYSATKAGLDRTDQEPGGRGRAGRDPRQLRGPRLLSRAK